MSFTKKPMKPIMANPAPVAMAIFENSFLSGFAQRRTSILESLQSRWQRDKAHERDNKDNK
jgi:hypothetical protein